VLAIPIPFLLFGILCYGFYLIFIASRRRATERVLHLLADTVRLDLPLLPAVASAAEDANFWERRILLRLAWELEAGCPLAEAVHRAGNLFPPLVVSQINLGLRCGQLTRAMDNVVRNQRSREDRRLAWFGPVLYLSLLPILAASTSWMILMFLIPRFKKILDDFGETLPWRVEALIALATIMVLLSLVGLLMIVASLVLFLTGRQASGSGWVSNLLDRLRWCVPGWRSCERLTNLAAAARHLSLALAAGETGTEALQQAAALKLNVVVRRRLARALDLHRAGQKSFAECFRAAGGFPQHFLWTVATGEAAGNLSLALENLADEYEARQGRLKDIIWNAVQVAVVILIGGYVGLHGLVWFQVWERLVQSAGGW